MTKPILSMAVIALAIAVLSFVSCNAIKSCGTQSPKSKDCSVTSTTSNNTTMKREIATCEKCGKTSCDHTCTSNPSLISNESAMNKEIIDGCADKFTGAEKEMAEQLLESGFIKKVKSINEIKNGYELVYDEPIEFTSELLKIVALEKKCFAGYTIALSFDPNSNVIRYQYLGLSNAKKKEMKTQLTQLGLGHLFKN